MADLGLPPAGQLHLFRVVPQILLTIDNPAPKYPVTAEADFSTGSRESWGKTRGESLLKPGFFM